MWKDLSIQQKSEVMKMAISQGLIDLNEIKKMYDASIPNIEASSVNNTYSSVPYNPSPKDVRYDDGGHLYPAGGILTIGATSWPQVAINTVRNRLYDNLVPFGYHHPTERVYNSVIANKKELLEDGVMDDDTKETLDALWGTYLNIPNSNRHSVHSNNAIERSQGPDPNKVYYRLNNLDPIIDTVVDEGIGYEMSIRKDPRAPYVYYPHEGLKVGESKIVTAGNQVLGDFTVGRGRDDRGEYLSYSDTWDINPWQKTANQYGQNNEGSEPFLSKVARSLVPKQGDASFGIGTPVNIYDKIYLDDLYGLSSDAVRGTMYLPEVTIWGKANPRKRKINLSSPSDTFAYGGPLGNIYQGKGNKSQKLSKAERENRAMWAKGQPFYKEMRLWDTGLSDVALAGILGNMGLESGFIATASNGTHHGYLQNENSIRDYIVKYYGGYGHKQQMQYLQDGLRGKLRGGNTSMGKQLQRRFNNYTSAVKNVTDPIKASQLWEKYYEISGGQAMGARQRYAKHFYDQMSASGPGAFRRAKLDGTFSPIKDDKYIAYEPSINVESPVFHTAANDLQWQPTIVASSRQEDIAPLLVQNNKPLIVEPLENTSSTPKDFSAIWDQIFPKVENTQEEFNPLLDPSTQFTTLQSRPRYIPIQQEVVIPDFSFMANNGYKLFEPMQTLSYGGKVNRFDDGSIMIKQLPQEFVEQYPDMKVTTPSGNSVTLSEAFSKWGDTPILKNNVPHLSDFLTTQEQPGIATNREVELAQQHRTNEEFSRQMDNFWGGNWIRPSQIVGAFNPHGYEDNITFGERLLLGTDNTGLVSKEFMQKHPYISEGLNLAFDFATPGIMQEVKNIYNSARNYRQQLLHKSLNNPNIGYEDIDFSHRDSKIDNYIYGKWIAGEEVFPGKSQHFQRGLDPEVTDYLMKNKVGRDMLALEKEGVDPTFIESKRKNLEKIMKREVQVGEYSGADYEKAGKGHSGGTFYEDKNFISVNRDSKFPRGYVQKHEGTHLLDKYHTLTDEQSEILNSAYGKDFIDLPKWEEASDWLRDYTRMEAERVTTNRDARDLLLGDYQKFDIHAQNLIIDKMSDEKIIEAVKEANGYGRNYIEYLEKTNKLTPEKIQQFREAMKKVGVVTGATAGIAKATSN